MTSAAMRKTPDDQFDADIGKTIAKGPSYMARPTAGATGHASPVHEMQARLEEAVFASFSAKQSSGGSHVRNARSTAIVLAAALGGWGLLLAGVSLTMF